MFPLPAGTLIKLFSREFFRANAGWLIFICVTIGTSFFYIETAGDINLLTQEERTFYHFIMMITFIRDPLMTVMICLLWLLYTLKSWTYVTGLFRLPRHEFLRYSLTSMSRAQQFQNWFLVQFVILSPLFIYWLVSLAAGIIFHEWLLPFITICFLLLLAVSGGMVYTLASNRLIDGNQTSLLLRWSHRFRKSYFTLFIYQVFENLKLVYFLTKVISFLALLGILKLFGETGNQQNVVREIILLVIIAHSYIVYREREFTSNKLSFSANLPYPRWKLFLGFGAAFLLLLLPEIIWLFVTFDVVQAGEYLLLGLSVALLFRSLLYRSGLNMLKYVAWVFGIYIFFTQFIIYGLSWSLILFTLLTAWAIFYGNYYRSRQPV